MNKETIVQFRTVVVRSSVTRPANTTQYSIGDVISNVTTNAGFTFGTNASSASNATKIARREVDSATINAVKLFSSANQATKLAATLWLFKAQPSAIADSSAFAVSDQELLNLVGTVSIAEADWKIGNSGAGATGNAVAFIRNIDLPVNTNDAGQLFGVLVAENAYTPVASEIFTIDIVTTQD